MAENVAITNNDNSVDSKNIGSTSKSIWNPANIVTCVRIALVPLFAALALTAQSDGSTAFPLASFVLLIVICLTDKLDGYLARSRNEITDFGKFLDPIADKLLVTAALIVLMQQDVIGAVGVLVILFREFIVSAVRMFAASRGEVIAAANMGRAKTAVTMVALCVLFAVPLFPFASSSYVFLSASGHFLYAVAVLLTIVSGTQYVWAARSLFV